METPKRKAYATKEAQAAASKRYYDNNRDAIRAAQAEKKRQTKAKANDLKRGPCTDCGVQYPPYVMQWDHRPGTEKLFTIGARSGTCNMETLLAEIAKCDLVCSNCHAERSAKRGGWNE